MVAALLLESRSAHLSSVPALSVTRANNSPWSLALILLCDIWNFVSISNWLYYCLVTVLVTTGLPEFSSTALLSDIRIGLLPGPVSNQTLNYDFTMTKVGNDWMTNMIPRIPAWNRNPSAYPNFAEYHENATMLEDGVDDTRLLLWAFLPFSNASFRENLLTYNGKTAVLDARVICQRPTIQSINAVNNCIYGSFTNSFNTSQLAAAPNGVASNCWLPTNDTHRDVCNL